MRDKKSLVTEGCIPFGISIERKYFNWIENTRGNENRSKFMSNILREYIIHMQSCSLTSKNKQKRLLPVERSFDARNQQVKGTEVISHDT